MTNLAGLPESAALVAAADDPGAFVIAALGRAKAWLEQATTTDLPELVEAKARAEAVRCYLAQKELGHDAELSAAEIVRRAERRIGELIREGQAKGEIRRRGQGSRDRERPDGIRTLSPTDFVSSGELSGNATGIYAMTDGITPDEFEEAVDDAKGERNLSRSNIVRKAREVKARRAEQAENQPREVRLRKIQELAETGHSSPQIAAAIGVGVEHVRRLAAEAGITVPADAVIGRVRAIDSNRIVQQTVETLEALVSTLELVEVDQVDADSVAGWVGSLRRSLRSLQRFTKELST